MICEICHGREFLLKGDEYICTRCNTRYTIEEAMKLMGNNDTDTSRAAQVKNYLDHAVQSRNTGAFFESEVYCNKALEIDAENYQALRLKAEVVALQTNYSDDRTVEAISTYEKALSVAPEEFHDNLQDTSAQVIATAVQTRAMQLGSQYTNVGSGHEGNALLGLPLYVVDRDARLREATGASILELGVRTNIANVMCNSAANAWNQRIVPSYVKNEHRDKAAMDAFVDGGDEVLAVIECAIGFDSKNTKENKQRYANLIAVQESLIDAHSMRDDGGRWVRAYSLSEENKASRCDDIQRWVHEVQEIDPGFTYESKPQSMGKEPDDSGKSILHRTVTWQMCIAMLCLARFFSIVSTPSKNGPFEALLWLGIGVAFAVWGYQASK